jgi:hypothetical protein
MPTAASWREREWRVWTAVQLAVSVGILALLAVALRSLHDLGPDVAVAAWQRQGMGIVLVVGLLGFAIRSVVLLGRLLGTPPRR